MVQAFNRRTTATETRVRTPRFEQYDYVTSYQNKRWIRLSAAWLKQYPFCVLCLAHGRTNQGAADFAISTQRNLVVDHIVPHRGDVSLFWDCDNLQTLCRNPCHDRDKQRCERRGIDWWEYMRKVIREQGSKEFIETYVEWLPDHVATALVVSRTAITAIST